MAKWSEGDGLYGRILSALNKRKKKASNVQDSLIAETTIKNGFILVTDDRDLLKVA